MIQFWSNKVGNMLCEISRSLDSCYSCFWSQLLPAAFIVKYINASLSLLSRYSSASKQHQLFQRWWRTSLKRDWDRQYPDRLPVIYPGTYIGTEIAFDIQHFKNYRSNFYCLTCCVCGMSLTLRWYFIRESLFSVKNLNNWKNRD